ncbi:hypothetical protein [Streptomyces sp. OE57]|uniref:hypothetical protein n=1 Tax=Streptomyces lacaronensis TaxID=3379885 RepID=UPI0039B743C8
MGTSSSIRISERGFDTLPAAVDLQPVGTGVWTNTGCQVTLPAAGTYHLDATVRATLTAADGVNVWIGARLWDVTAGVVVPDSEVLVYQIANTVTPATTAVTEGGNQSGAVLVPYTVPGSRVIRLQAVRNVAGGNSSVARVISDANGRTTLRFERIA